MIKFNLLSNKKTLKLYSFDRFLGVCGTPTKFKDVYGDMLFVGDIVKVFDNAHIVPDFLSVVVEHNNEYSIWGIFDSFLKRNCEWRIRKYTCSSIIKQKTKIGTVTYE